MGSMSDLIEKFARLTAAQKWAGLAGILVVFGVGFYFLFYSELEVKADRLKRQRARLELTKAEYEEKKQKYMAFRAEVKKLLAQKKELLKVLPTQAEIPSLLQSLHAQAELAGLNMVSFSKQGEQPHGFYATIPVHMVIRGKYHQISKFFYSVGRLKRIVNVRDVLLTRAEGGQELVAKFVASTFRFIEKTPQG